MTLSENVYSILMFRNMTASERPAYTTMLKILTAKKETILTISPEEIVEGHSQACVSKAPLEAERYLYNTL